MGDATKFSTLFAYYAFHIGFITLIVTELFIFVYTYNKGVDRTCNCDKGTKWLLYLNFMFTICISFILVSKHIPCVIRTLLFPTIFSFIGIGFIYIGIIIRCYAVMTLKRNFTLHVQTQHSQQLIKVGLYKYIRHPAYTGSILSLLGISLAFKNIYATVLTFICCMVCYQIRISVEEKALLEYFKEDYEIYKLQTKKLFPKLY